MTPRMQDLLPRFRPIWTRTHRGTTISRSNTVADAVSTGWSPFVSALPMLSRSGHYYSSLKLSSRSMLRGFPGGFATARHPSMPLDGGGEVNHRRRGPCAAITSSVSLPAYRYSQTSNEGNIDDEEEERLHRPPDNFLTAEDHLEEGRRYATLSDEGYEIDLDSMAGNYNPEAWWEQQEDLDRKGLGLDPDPMDRSALYHRSSPPNPKPRSSPSSSSSSSSMKMNNAKPTPPIPGPAATPSDTPDQMKKRQSERETTESLSPLSYISIIADPYSDDDTPEISSLPSPPPPSSSSPSSLLQLKPNVAPFMENDDRVRSPPPQSQGQPMSQAITSTAPASKDLELSVDEFRAKYTYNQQDREVDNQSSKMVPPMVESSRRQDTLLQLEMTLQRLEEDIVTANNGKHFNLASYQQVSMALFGTPNESTSKYVLEAMAMSNILAKLILEHRQTKQLYNKLSKQEQRKRTESRTNRNIDNDAVDQSSVPTVATNNNISSLDKVDTEPLMLVDTSSFIFRAYYSMPPMHRAIDGMPTSAVLGFCNMLNRMVMSSLLAGRQPRLVLCCDAPTPQSGGPKTMRHEMYPKYKANRQDAPMDLIPQFPFFRKAAKVYGMPWIEAPGYEADDVIASLCQKAMKEGLTVHIYSADKDLMQLITNSTSTREDHNGGIVEMIDPMSMTHWSHESVVEKWGVPAHQLGDVLALAGDTADNIPGVPGIGPKIAAELMQRFGSLEGLYQNLEQVTQTKRRENLDNYRDQAFLSKALVELERNLDWEAMLIDGPAHSVVGSLASPPERVADLRMAAMNPDRILHFYDELGFVTIKQRLIDRLKRQNKINYSYDISIAGTSGNGRNMRNRGTAASTKASIPKPEDYDSVPF